MDSLQKAHEAYWRTNILVVLALLFLWAVPSFVLGIVYVEEMNEFSIGGFPLGFWFAQQGSIIIFVVLILIYALLMDKIDRKFLKDHPEEPH